MWVQVNPQSLPAWIRQQKLELFSRTQKFFQKQNAT
jgi:hypothetical protein